MGDNPKMDVPDANEANSINNKKIIDNIVKILNENNISNMLISFNDESNEPVIFYRGNFYEIAKLTCKLANSFRSKIAEELS